MLYQHGRGGALAKTIQKVGRAHYIGSPAGPCSSVWRFFFNKGRCLRHVRGTGVDKFSFHASGVCRMAFTAAHGTPNGMSDRVHKPLAQKSHATGRAAKGNEGFGSSIPERLFIDCRPSLRKRRPSGLCQHPWNVHNPRCFFTNDAEEVVRSFAAPLRTVQMYVRLA